MYNVIMKMNKGDQAILCRDCKVPHYFNCDQWRNLTKAETAARDAAFIFTPEGVCKDGLARYGVRKGRKA